MAIATNLKQIRMERNLHQEDIAIAIGSSLIEDNQRFH